MCIRDRYQGDYTRTDGQGADGEISLGENGDIQTLFLKNLKSSRNQM